MMRLLPITARKALSLVALTLMGCVWTTVTTSFAPRTLAAGENYQLIQEPGAGFSRIIGLISGAARTVRITMYELNDPAAVNALIDAHGRGVDTRVILDAAFHGHDANAESLQELSDAGVDVKWAPNGVIYHQKTITVDDTTAAIGTGNLTPHYYSTSRDAWILDTNPTDVAAIAATFDTDYTAAPSGHPPEATPAPNLIGRRQRGPPSCSVSTRLPSASMSLMRNSKTGPCCQPWTRRRTAVCNAASFSPRIHRGPMA
jgi:hypothetical protein